MESIEEVLRQLHARNVTVLVEFGYTKAGRRIPRLRTVDLAPVPTAFE